MAHPMLHAAAVVLGLVGIVLALAFGTQTDPAHPRENDLSGWGGVVLLVGILFFVGGLVSLNEKYKAREGREQRIKRLTAALDESMRIISQINAEMEEGQARLSELERQTTANQELAQLSSREAAAVRAVLIGELAAERRRSLWRDLALVLLGAVLSYLATRFL